MVSTVVDRLKVMLGFSTQDQVGAHENLQSLSLPCSVQGVLPPPPGLQQIASLLQSWLWGCLSLWCDPSVPTMGKRMETPTLSSLKQCMLER